MKKALITGITGQDGSYMAELLLEKGYEVHGLVRRVAMEDPERRMWRIHHLIKRIQVHYAAVDSFPALYRVMRKVQPDECYHLAAQSYVSYAFEDEFSTIDTNLHGAHYMLGAIEELSPDCRFYFAATSEMFGEAESSPQNEQSRFRPRSAYGISKVTGFELTRNYRERYKLHASSGILYNHESPRRGYEYVTRKITHGAARIKLGLARELTLGNLDARRDWGHAQDYVMAMWLMTQQKEPADYVISSGALHSVREFTEMAFSHVGLDYKKYVVVDQKLFRPSEGVPLVGDSTKARTTLGWKPEIPFETMVAEMVDNDMKVLQDKTG